MINLEEFTQLWQQYALAEDDTLDTHARALKRQLLEVTGVKQLREELEIQRKAGRLIAENYANNGILLAHGVKLSPNILVYAALQDAQEAASGEKEV
jgi:hypothetical protein